MLNKLCHALTLCATLGHALADSPGQPRQDVDGAAWPNITSLDIPPELENSTSVDGDAVGASSSVLSSPHDELSYVDLG